MTQLKIPTIDDVRAAVPVIRKHFSPPPLIRSYAIEKRLNLPETRRVWIKDYGWTPVGSFKLMGALNWMENNEAEIGERCVAAHSSGNFASGISFAGMRYGKRVMLSCRIRAGGEIQPDEIVWSGGANLQYREGRGDGRA